MIAMKNSIRAVAFILIGVFLFLALQDVFTPNWWPFGWPYDEYFTPMDALNEYHAIFDADNELQVVFIGSSPALYGIDPMRIYQSVGITSFNFGTFHQSLEVSLLRLREVLDIQHPSLVFFEVTGLFTTTFADSNYRYNLDFRPMDKYKWSLAKEYATHFPKEEKIDRLVSAIAPIYYYHDNWSQLSNAFFKSTDGRNLYKKGFYNEVRITPSIVDAEAMNTIADTLTDRALYYPVMRYDYQIYLQQIQAICMEHGVELCFLKVPAIFPPQQYSSAWTKQKSDAVRKVAEEMEIEFLDLLYDYELNLNFNTDSPDQGMHLNVKGAKKVTDFIADYLVNEKGLIGKPSAAYDEDLPIYQKIEKTIDLQYISPLNQYLEYLAQMDNVSVFFCANDDMMTSLTADEKACLNAFGLKTDFNKLSYGDAYVAVVENGRLEYEESSDGVIEYAGNNVDGARLAVKSLGWYLSDTTIPNTYIEINGIDYSMKQRGINIVVYDNETGHVIDSVSFDTWAADSHPALRDSYCSEKYFREYEEYLMRQDYERGLR